MIRESVISVISLKMTYTKYGVFQIGTPHISVLLISELQAITKIFAELFHQAVRPIAGWFQTTHEEAEHLGFVNKLQTTNEVTIVVQPVHTVDYIVDL